MRWLLLLAAVAGVAAGTRDRMSEAHGLLNGAAGEEKGEANVKVRKGG